MDALTRLGGVRLDLPADGRAWRPTLSFEAGTGPAGASAAAASSSAESVASRWLIEQLAAGPEPERPLGPGFRLVRLIRPGRPGAGERRITVDQTNRSVVVGELAVVKWLRQVEDAEQPALTGLAHLAELGFAGVPATFGALTWTAPSGAEVPLALATAFLPGAVDGWQWCLDAVESGDRPDFPAELGRLLAGLHAAFATASSVLPEPVAAVGGEVIGPWQAAARARLAEVVARIGEVDGASAGPENGRPQRPPSRAIEQHREAMAAAIDRLAAVRGTTPVQRVHGDLHVGQVLSWPGGLAVIDFDGNPVLSARSGGAAEPAAGAVQSPVRDLAQLLLSVDQVGRIADRRAGFSITAEVDAWSRAARADLLAAYRRELADRGRPEVLDLRLLPSFLVEQACRDLIYSIRFLPRWAYATIDALDTLLAESAPS